MFQLLLDRSTDAVWVFDPQAVVFRDCNSAPVKVTRTGARAEQNAHLLRAMSVTVQLRGFATTP